MSNENDIKKKLSDNAIKVDKFIDSILTPKRPEILYNASKYLISAGGKRLRPFLTLKSCEAVGGDPDLAIPFAGALEILHNFTLVHDDILDNDPIRRGNPSVHIKFGVPLAICAGDLLFAKVFEAMTIYSPKKINNKQIRKSIEIASKATIEICEGQVLDVTFADTEKVSEEDYIFMVSGKTGALFRACAEIGGTIGKGKKSQIKALGKFAYNAGIAFQIVDDILGLTADEKTLGKPTGSDIREGKKTIIIIHAMSKISKKDLRIIRTALGNHRASKSDIENSIELIKNLGSIEYASKRADKYISTAKKQLKKLPDSESKKDLNELIDYFTKRNY
ncbi:polyprenyl synthetase family protein [Candidatus Bathyarchaeota archaeon]|nr:polyprenyl synthetase family protein [Candidatus Bathyarchaeota archaeon]